MFIPVDGFMGAVPDWIRITIGTPEQNEKVLAALKDILWGGGRDPASAISNRGYISPFSPSL